MIRTILLVVVVILIMAAIAWFVLWRRRPVQLKTDEFEAKWRDLQKLLRDKTKWGEAIVGADDLLDLALKKKRIPGRGMGERMVKAQRLFTDNDGVWFGHKLRGQIDHEPGMKLKEPEVKQALVGIRQALKDVGALPHDRA